MFNYLKNYRDKIRLSKEVKALKEKVEQLEDKLAQQSTLMDVFEKNIIDIIYFKDRKGNFIRINKALADKFNIEDPEFAVGKNDVDLFKDIDEIHAKESYDDECDVMNSNKPKTGIKEHVIYPNGDDVWQITDKFPLYNKKGEVIGTWGRSVDITEREKDREELEKQSKIDGLTRVWCREYINRLINQKIEALLDWGDGCEEIKNLSLVFLDLDGFKQVNDKYGHDAGDVVLKEVSSFIKSKTRSDIDIFGRWGGDEFIILYPNVKVETAKRLIDKVREQIKSVKIGVVDQLNKKHTLTLSFSVGVVDFNQCIDKEKFQIFKDMFDKMKYDIKREQRGPQLRKEDQKRIEMVDENRSKFIRNYKLAKKNLRNGKVNLVNIFNYDEVPMINPQKKLEEKEIIISIIKSVFIYIADKEMYKNKPK
jgi:diguanylate cyclase (GGDEF)-like protein